MNGIGEGRGATARGVLAIVIAGAVLGLCYNALARVAWPARGLAWIASEEKLPALETMADSAARIAGTAPDSMSASTGARTPGATSTEAGPIATAPPPAGPSRGTPPEAPPATRTEPPPAVAPAATATDPGLPAVPDADHAIEVQLPTFKRFFDARAALIVDAREAGEYAQGHIAGAISLPYDDVVSSPRLLDRVRHAGRPIVVYCSGPGCDLSKQLATSMLAEGIRKVLVFEGGYPAWQAAGYPVETGAGAAP